MSLLTVVGADSAVPLVDGRFVRYVNLDTAASAPALTAVAEHVGRLLPHYSSVHRGAGYASRLCTMVYEEARGTIAGFVGAREDDVVVFTRNTTDAFGLLSHAVDGDTVVLDIEHHANLLPWQRSGVRVVRSRPALAGTLAAIEDELRRRPAALLAITGASNVTGECPPLRALAGIAHRHGARLAVDGAQLVPHRRVDLAADGIDYLAFSGHKLYAPFGAGVLIGRADWLDAAPAYLGGGGAVRNVTLDEVRWAPAPARHEAGTPNVIGVAALAMACRQLGALRPGALAQHERALMTRLGDGLAGLGLRPYRIWSEAVEAVGIATFTVPGVPAGKVAAYLSAEHGIGVRDGRFCAHPLLARLDVDAAVRVSVGVGSGADDIDRLLDGLRALIGAGPRWQYTDTGGGWAPHPETRRLPDWLGALPLSADAGSCDPAPEPATR